MKKGISSLTASNLKFKPQHSDKLFFGRWPYCVKARLAEVSVLRYGTYERTKIDAILDQRIEWRNTIRRRWAKDFLGSRTIITQAMRENLYDLAAIFQKVEHEHKIVVSSDCFWVYTDSIDFIKRLDDLPYLSHKKFVQIMIDRPPGTIKLKNPQHAYRSYMRCRKLDPNAKAKLQAFLSNYQDIRISPGLQDWLIGTYNNTMDYFFIDYNDAGWELMLGLVQPGLIRKTVQIITK